MIARWVWLLVDDDGSVWDWSSSKSKLAEGGYFFSLDELMAKHPNVEVVRPVRRY